jgi:hypothetical protein
MRRKDNDNHILTPTERLFYQRMSMEGIKQIIDECWKIIKNPQETIQVRHRVRAFYYLDVNRNVIYPRGSMQLSKVDVALLI